MEQEGDDMRLKEFKMNNYNRDKVLIDTDSISSAYETIINGRCATVVVMQHGESYTLDMSISEFKRVLDEDG